MEDSTFHRPIDPRALYFSPLGLGGPMPVDTCEELLRDEMGALVLPGDVPEGVQELFRDLKRLYMDGLFNYQYFTHAERDAYRVLEAALKVRFQEHYGGALPIVVGGRQEHLPIQSFQDVDGRFHQRQGRPVLQNHPEFDGSLRSLVQWARAEGYFYGQANRIRERAMVGLRNLLTHSEGRMILAPPDVLRTLSYVHQLIRRLWGHNTPGSAAYPGPVHRYPWVIGLGPLHGESTSYPLALWPDVRDDENERQRRWYVVLAVPGEELLQWTPEGEVTGGPVTVLEGPLDWKGLAEKLDDHRREWPTDEVELLDRPFAVRVSQGKVDVPRCIDQVPLVRANRGDRWAVVKADHPLAARGHVIRALAGRCEVFGPCGDCPAEGVLDLSTRPSVERWIASHGGTLA